MLKVERTIESLVNCVPNLLDDRVPQGEDESDNVVIRYHHTSASGSTGSTTHTYIRHGGNGCTEEGGGKGLREAGGRGEIQAMRKAWGSRLHHRRPPPDCSALRKAMIDVDAVCLSRLCVVSGGRSCG